MNAIWILTGLAAVLLLLKFMGGASADPEAAKAALAKGALLLDVRSAGEHAGGHLAGSLNVPVDQLPGGIGKAAIPKDRPILVYCASGMRSARAAGLLKQAGYAEVLDLGGIAKARAVVGG